VNNVVSKHLQLLPLIWLTTLLPGLAAGIALFMPRRLGQPISPPISGHPAAS